MLTIIAAVAINNALGKNNDLIWSLPADLKRFKKVTLGHHVIMGRKTFESLGKPLPNRTTIIISRNKDYKAERVAYDDVQEIWEFHSKLTKELVMDATQHKLDVIYGDIKIMKAKVLGEE